VIATPAPKPRGRAAWLGLIGFIAVCLAVSAIGGWITSTSVGTWYPTLAKPSFTPPDAVFAPVWTVLYVMMAVAAWRVWRHAGLVAGRTALALFAVQLALNLAWSALFFGLHAIGWALVDILALWCAIAATSAAFWRIDRPAGLLLLPYLAWVSYAVALNAAIWRLN
jgi:translocator protein